MSAMVYRQANLSHAKYVWLEINLESRLDPEILFIDSSLEIIESQFI